MSEQWFSIKQVSIMYGASTAKLKRLIKSGEIRAKKMPADHGGVEFKISSLEIALKPELFVSDELPYCRRRACRFNINGCTILTECLDKLMKPCPFFKLKGK